MSHSSKPKKIKQKGTVRELKLVQTVNRRGHDALRAEEVETPRRGSQSTPSTSQRNHASSPLKRPKLGNFNAEPIPCHLDGPDSSKRQRTLVLIFHHGR